jgi:hypothetical protein
VSRIYFQTKNAEAEVYGTERAHMGALITDLATTILIDGMVGSADHVRRLLPTGSYMDRVSDRDFTHMLRCYLGVGEPLLYRDEKIDPFVMALDTALTLGGDPLRLYARVHGQCEIHGYVEETNRQWLARIVREGLATNLFRAGPVGRRTGWEDVIALLEDPDGGPVVSSYSVTEDFPNLGVAGIDDEEAWDTLSDDEQWDLAVAGLRGMSEEHGLEWKPDGWSEFRFGGVTAFDLLRQTQPTLQGA